MPTPLVAVPIRCTYRDPDNDLASRGRVVAKVVGRSRVPASSTVISGASSWTLVNGALPSSAQVAAPPTGTVYYQVTETIEGHVSTYVIAVTAADATNGIDLSTFQSTQVPNFASQVTPGSQGVQGVPGVGGVLPYTAQGASTSLIAQAWHGHDTTAAARTATLPAADANAVTVKTTVQVSWDAADAAQANLLTVTTAGSDQIVTVDGLVSSVTVPLLGEVLTFQAVALNRWRRVQSSAPAKSVDLRARANLSVAGALPAGLGWDAATFPITPSLIDNLGTGVHTGSIGMTPEALFNSKSTALSAPGAMFYVSTTGVDTNAGTSASPFRSLQKAVQAANAAAVPTLVYVAAGVYQRSSSLYMASVAPTVDIAFVATGGRVATGTFDLVSAWTNDTTYTRTWTAAIANCDRVVDTAVPNELGNHRELTQVADATACNLVPNSWALVGGTLYVHRGDEAAPTANNLRVFRNQPFNLYVSAAINFYMGGNGTVYGFDLEGCPGSAVAVFAQGASATSNPKRLIVLANSTFKYGGGAIGTATNGVGISAWNGLLAAFNCAADANASDGWNNHDGQGAAFCGMLTVNCQGLDNGRGTQQSCNGWTNHEATKAVDIAGRYRRNRGGTIRNINTTKAYLLGTVIEDDLGDIRQGGVVPPTAVRADDSAEIWAERVRTVMPAGGLAYATGSGTAKIHRRGCASPAQPDLVVGTIDSY